MASQAARIFLRVVSSNNIYDIGSDHMIFMIDYCRTDSEVKVKKSEKL